MFYWIQNLADWLIYNVFQLAQGSKLGDALNFFVYDTLKILILLFLITSVMGIVNSYFPIEKVRNFLSRNKLYGLEYLFASTFGAVTPFCSCSSVPLFIGFVKGGIPLGVTFAFLITSVSSYYGYYTSGGALEVGRSSTNAVVYSSILILLFSLIYTNLFIGH